MSFGVLGVDLLVQVLLRGLALGLGLGLLLQQVSVRLKRRPLVGVERVVADLLQPCLHGLRGDLLLVALALDHLGQQSFLAAVLLSHLVELLLERGELVVERFDGIAFGDEVAGDENRRGNKVDLKRRLPFR